MDQLLSHWLKIRPDERRRTALLFVLLFCCTSFIIIGRTARDALLLSRVGIDQLPLMYVGIAVASSLVVLIYSRLLTRVTLYKLFSATLALSALALLVLWGLLRAGWLPACSIFYIFMEVAGSILVVEFWTFAYESFSTREARRLFGIIGSGGVMAGTLGGFGGGWLAPLIGTPNLLPICCLCLGAGYLLTRQVHQLPQPLQTTARVLPRPGKLSAQLTHASDRYTVILATFVIMTSVAVSLVDFEFKAIVVQHYQEAELARFFGRLYGVCGLLSFGAHLFFTGRVLMRLGILPGLLALPGVLVAGAGALIWAPSLAAAVYVKAADATLRYSLNDTCVQLLYLPLPVGSRRRLKALIDGAIKPFAIGLAGLMLTLVGASGDALRLLAFVMLICLVAWIVFAFYLRREYVAALLATLDVRRAFDDELPASLYDMASRQALAEALRSPDARVVLGALEILPSRRGAEWSSLVLPLLSSTTLELKLAAMEYFQREAIPVPDEVIQSWLEAEDATSRQVAVELLRGGPGTERFLNDPAPQVRARAIVGLVRRVVDQLDQAAIDELERMTGSALPQVREEAAWAVGELGGPEHALRTLLLDAEVEVVRAALDAAGKAQILSLAPLLIARLADPAVADDAANALGRYGEVVLGGLLELFPLHEAHEDHRSAVFLALHGIGTRRVTEELIRRLPQDRLLRHEMLQASFQLIRHRQDALLRLDQVRAPLLVEVQDCYQWWAVLREVGRGDAWLLFSTTLTEELRMARERVFWLLSHAYPVKPIQSLNQALSNSRSTLVANALEAADEILEPELRTFIMPLLDQLTIEERLARGREMFQLQSKNEVGWIRHFLAADRPWWVLCALSVAMLDRMLEVLPEVRGLVHHAHPAVREAAVTCYGRLLPPDQRPAWWHAQLESPDARARELARAFLAKKEILMISSVDKVLFLKRVELFSQLPGRELMNLADISEQVIFPEQVVIFEEGSEGDSLYLILSGHVRVSSGGRQIAVLGPRECFGEMAILDREPRSATVTAIEQVSALRIERDSFHELLSQKREISLAIIRILVARLRAANERLSPGD